MSEPSPTGRGDLARAEHRARAAADLVLGSELLPGPVPLPDFASLLAARTRRRRHGWVVGSLASLAAMSALALVLLRERSPISYVVDGTVAIADDVIDAPATGGGAAASVRFSEGTEVGLAPGARIRVMDRTAHGAALALDRGKARFAVTHRSGAHWSVATGPFTVEVVGTRFVLDWSPRDKRLVIDLTSGSVRVRGASVGGPVEMHPGERLTATAADRRVTLSPLPEGAGPGSAGPEAAREPSGAESEAALAGDLGKELGGELDAAAPVASATSAPARVHVVRRTTRATRHSLQLALAHPAQNRQDRQAPPPASPAWSAPVAAERPAPPAVRPNAPEPRPLPAPALSLLNAGGTACARESSQYRFERAESGIALPDFYTLAFANPRPDHTRSWCGQGSLRLDATFNDAGKRNFFGRFAKETGQVVLNLHRATDFTGKTVTVHFFVDGPADARFTAELVVVNRGRWVSGPPSGHLTAGRWWTISHRFEAENASGVPGSSNPGPFPVGGTSPVSSCDRLGIALHSTGGRRVWTGAVYVDDVGWR